MTKIHYINYNSINTTEYHSFIIILDWMWLKFIRPKLVKLYFHILCYNLIAIEYNHYTFTRRLILILLLFQQWRYNLPVHGCLAANIKDNVDIFQHFRFLIPNFSHLSFLRNHGNFVIYQKPLHFLISINYAIWNELII